MSVGLWIGKVCLSGETTQIEPFVCWRIKFPAPLPESRIQRNSWIILTSFGIIDAKDVAIVLSVLTARNELRKGLVVRICMDF